MNDINDHNGEQRLADIDLRLAKLQAGRDQKDRLSKSALPDGSVAVMGRVATELVAGVIVGTFIGWVLDRWLETSPLFLVMMFFLGAAAGMLNVWRIVSGRGLATGYFEEHRQDAGKTGKDD